ncbi:MAG: polysaccharide biosynthesis protein [Acidobacteriota bacterium]|nr:polysaccharide biosynthesis protein [Acidobacteriota bacterium]
MLRYSVVYTMEAGAIVLAAVAAFFLRFDFGIPAIWAPVLRTGLAVWLPVKLLSFRVFGLDRRWARYVSISDLARLLVSNTTASIAATIVLHLIHAHVPRTIYALDFLLCVCVTSGMRASVRVAAEAMRPKSLGHQTTRTLIYGAGDAGLALLRDIRRNPNLNYDICGLIDDSARKQGVVLHGAKVLGDGESLEAIVRKVQADLVLIAIPAATGEEMRTIIERCISAGARYKTIPGLVDLIQENGLARQIRDVAVEDLLGRNPVHLEQDRISSKLRGRVVMVTGAAGSIGSEICRQLARFQPEAVVGFEIAESALFHLQMELTRTHPEITFHAEIGSIQNRMRLNEVFAKHQPSIVYHAAAYKHVPLMESHAFEAVENNVMGTLNVVEAARDHGVRDFVMISSDKAVRPANVMGVTKRMAELVVRSRQPEGGTYVSVRFGNVLGSNGSVVPIFKDQIARGGPVTVTHPEMRRYFMTIPEACQLVLQASTMGRGGEIFVLDMGEPVKIVDLARNLIMLSGLRPEQDIRIEFTGARPGEKLFEELNEDAEDLVATHHEKINVFAGETKPWAEIEQALGQLRGCCRERNCADMVRVLLDVVPEYRPSAEIAGHAGRARVAEGV